MAKITLNPIVGSYASVVAINARLQQIEDVFNDDVLWRGGFTVAENSMAVDLDMAGNDVLNADRIGANVLNARSLVINGTLSNPTASYTASEVADVDTIADLRLLNGDTALQVSVRGYYTSGDDGGGLFYWSSTSPATDNGGTVIKPTAVVGNGRWLRINEHVVSVRAFGATDGVVNTAIQDAIDAEGQIYIPAGLFPISASIEMVDGSSITGDGDDSIIQLAANTPVIVLDGVDNVDLKNFKIDGNSAVYNTITSSNNGIYGIANGTGCNTVKIDNVSIVDLDGAGIIFLAQTGSHSKSISITNNYIWNTGTHGIICQDYVDNTYIVGNDVGDFGMSYADRPGITTGRFGVGHTVNNNIVTGNAASLGTSVHGISLDNGYDATCNGNVIRNTIGYGIEIGGMINAVCNGNAITNTQRSGITVLGTTLQAASDVSIVGNTIKGGDAQGIYLWKGTATLTKDVVITGNMIKQSGTIGVHIADACENITVASNNIRNCVESGISCDKSNHIAILSNTIKDNNTSLSVTEAGLKISNTTLETDYLIEPNNVSGNGIADYNVANPILNNGLAVKPASTVFAAGDLTPSIAFGDTFITGGTNLLNNFDDSKGEGDSFKLLAAHSGVLVVNSAQVKTSTGANKTLALNGLYTFTMIGGVWYESATI